MRGARDPRGFQTSDALVSRSGERARRLRFIRSLVVVSVLGSVADAQVADRVHRLFSPRPGGQTFLMDRSGIVVHTWDNPNSVANSVYMRENGNLMRAIKVGSTSPLATLPGSGGGVQEMAFDGTVLWDFRYDTATELAHHDIHPMPNGNVIMIAWETKTTAEATAAGRDPALITGDTYPDHLIEVQRTGLTTGQIVWEWHVWDHLIQDFDASQANFGVVADNPGLIDVNFPGTPGGELHHFNGVDYDPIHDWIIVSSRTQDEIWIIDHSTTTAEAAGHTGGNHGKGGDFLYRWGNPLAYQRGTAADQKLFGQHYPKFILPGYPGAGNITVFNNDPPSVESEVLELVLPLDANDDFILPTGGTYGPTAPVWMYSGPAFYSRLMSSAERLPSGNTLVCSSLQGRIFEVDPAGTIVFETAVAPQIQAATFHATHSARTLWGSVDGISVAAGGTIAFELVAGSEFDNKSMLLLGSYTGTSPGLSPPGWNIPLNPDCYMNYLYSIPVGQYHTGNWGRLDSFGRRTATLTLPPGLAMGFEGTTFHHAVVTFTQMGLVIRDVSNPVPFLMTP